MAPESRLGSRGFDLTDGRSRGVSYISNAARRTPDMMPKSGPQGAARFIDPVFPGPEATDGLSEFTALKGSGWHCRRGWNTRPAWVSGWADWPAGSARSARQARPSRPGIDDGRLGRASQCHYLRWRLARRRRYPAGDISNNPARRPSRRRLPPRVAWRVPELISHSNPRTLGTCFHPSDLR